MRSSHVFVIAGRPHPRRLGAAGDGPRPGRGRVGRLGLPRVRRTRPQRPDRSGTLRQSLVDGRRDRLSLAFRLIPAGLPAQTQLRSIVHKHCCRRSGAISALFGTRFTGQQSAHEPGRAGDPPGGRRAAAPPGLRVHLRRDQEVRGRQRGALAANMAHSAFVSVFPLLLILVTVLVQVASSSPPGRPRPARPARWPT